MEYLEVYYGFSPASLACSTATRALPWLLLRRKGYVGYSDVRLAKSIGASNLLHLIPIILLSLGFAALSFALARPQNVQVITSQTIKARDIIVAVDKSGSSGSPLRRARFPLVKPATPSWTRNSLPGSRNPTRMALPKINTAAWMLLRQPSSTSFATAIQRALVTASV